MEACKGVDVAVMVGGFPRKGGMERKDVMAKNVEIYKSQASALEKGAKKDVKVNHILAPYIKLAGCLAPYCLFMQRLRVVAVTSIHQHHVCPITALCMHVLSGSMFMCVFATPVQSVFQNVQ